MCGRFALGPPAKSLAEHYRLDVIPDIGPRYNIAPTQDVATICRTSPAEGLALKMRRWGLVPSWAKDMKIGSKLINARSETVADKPAFRAALRRRRCLIPASGFFEWKRRDGSKQPYYFTLKDGGIMSFASLWECWKEGGGRVVESCTILTTGANGLMEPIHSRMPVIVDPSDYNLWLNPAITDAGHLQPLLAPYPAEKMGRYPVGSLVNSPQNDDPQCIEPVEESI
ncbi:MAG: SOS response-associated peptidase [Candidatus Latescibacteria bacterium]|nr:SOS response-associated peptidase [Candidatus Latescibacterota bacterium]